MPPKFILCDLDGILIRTDKTISEKSESVLAECKKRGAGVADFLQKTLGL